MQPPPKLSRKQLNPLPDQQASVKVLRACTDCPVTADAQQIQSIASKVAELDNVSELAPLLAESFSGLILWDNHCRENLTKRKVLNLKEDEEITAITASLQSAGEDLDRLHKEFTEKQEKLQRTIKDRWDKIVSKYGLNPDDYSYSINEDSGDVYMLDLKCPECKFATTMRKHRQDLNAAIVTPKAAAPLVMPEAAVPVAAPETTPAEVAPCTCGCKEHKEPGNAP